MSGVLEHLVSPVAAVAEVWRVLRPGGVFVGSVPFLCQGIHADPNDFYRYTAAGLESLLADFRTVTVMPHGNGLGVAWRMVFGRFRFLAPFNPVFRQFSRRTDPTYAEGYVFRAVR